MDAPFQLKGDFFVIGLWLTFLKSPAVRRDEFDAVGDDLEGGAVLAIIGCPLILVEDADNGDPGSLVEIG